MFCVQLCVVQEAERKPCFKEQERKNLFVWLPEDFCIQGSHVFMENIWGVTDYDIYGAPEQQLFGRT